MFDNYDHDHAAFYLRLLIKDTANLPGHLVLLGP